MMEAETVSSGEKSVIEYLAKVLQSEVSARYYLSLPSSLFSMRSAHESVAAMVKSGISEEAAWTEILKRYHQAFGK